MTSVRSAIDDYRYSLLRLSESTQREYMGKLLVFAAWCATQKREDGTVGLVLEDIRQATIRRFVEHLRIRTQPHHPDRAITASTVHGYMRVLKAFLNWLGREDDYEGTISPKVVARMEMPKVEQKVMAVFDDNHILSLFAACEQEYNAELRVRDRAILSVLLDTGVRASELTGLTLDNCFLDPLDAHLKVHGKGNKWREVPLGKQSLVALRRYITRFRHTSKDQAIVFLNRYDEPLTVWGLDQIIDRLGGWADISPRSLCHPHTFRHTFAVRFLEATGDVYRLSRVMGHSSVKVTEIYVRATSAKSARSGVSVLDRLK